MNVIDNRMYIGELPASRVVDRFGTPIYVYDEEVIRFKYREFAESIEYPKVMVCYAAKANSNPVILKILREEGAGICATSPGEIMAALNAGYDANEIVFTCPAATEQDLKFAIARKILVNIDSVQQLEMYGRLNKRSKVCLRINHAVREGSRQLSGPDSKFGIWIGNLDEALSAADAYNLKVIGLHQHIGTAIMDSDTIVNGMEVLLAAAKNFKNLELINFGGGFGVPASFAQPPLAMNRLGARISSILKNFAINYGEELLFIFEPGRYIVADSGALLCAVSAVKKTPKRIFVGVDTGMNHLLRPALYKAYHQVVNVENVESEGMESVTVSGNIADSADVFTTGLGPGMLPSPRQGDVLAFTSAGAYGYSMASNYALRPKPAEILVTGKKMAVIRAAERDLAK
ncbi:diaminopimelate decarboxylase [Candidatus Woesearchaeota archaeon]|nr:diaminopimelate decarboxylase [Candidatus Woesearchaeota archaeon]